jgi:hypothetical protein
MTLRPMARPGTYNRGQNDTVLQAIVERAAAVLLTDPGLSEGFQVVHYTPGQHYWHHQP